MTFYNDFDSHACEWLRNLIEAELISEGLVDARSISDIQASELVRYRRCHFFAGIGGWDYALRLAGWPADRPVWTGSCPCQPLSSAGRRKGAADERHLWPEFYRLIGECRPVTVFGEQVGGSLGYEWLDGISLDLEALGYAVGSCDLAACSVGAPHIRQRLFWVAHAGHVESGSGHSRAGELETAKRTQSGQHASASGAHGRMADAPDQRDGWPATAKQSGDRANDGIPRTDGSTGRMGHAKGGEWGLPVRERGPYEKKSESFGDGEAGFWSDYDLIPCRDGKTRRTIAAVQCVADGPATGMVACSTQENEEGQINGTEEETDTVETLPTVRQSDGEKEIPVRDRGHDQLSETPILQPEMHGGVAGRKDQSSKRSGVTKTVGEDAANVLRMVRGSEGIARPSCGSESTEQRLQEPPDIVLALPQASTFAELQSDDRTKAALQALRQASPEARALLDAQYTPAEVWRSISDQGKVRLLMDIEAHGLRLAPLSPLVVQWGHGSRAKALKGIGNAIVPQVAAEFVRAFLDGLPTPPD